MIASVRPEHDGEQELGHENTNTGSNCVRRRAGRCPTDLEHALGEECSDRLANSHSREAELIPQIPPGWGPVARLELVRKNDLQLISATRPRRRGCRSKLIEARVCCSRATSRPLRRSENAAAIDMDDGSGNPT